MIKCLEKISRYSNKRLEHAVDVYMMHGHEGTESRHRSWTSCYNAFMEVHKNKDILENKREELKHKLAFYLASWGMFRGSSFISKYNADIFDGVIDIVYKGKYELLWNIDIEVEFDDYYEKFNEIVKELNEYLSFYKNFFYLKSYVYKGENERIGNRLITKTLITKILLGTMACCPAFDSYFGQAVGMALSDFYDENGNVDREKYEAFCYYIKDRRSIFVFKDYPLMKVVNMAFYQIGLENRFKKQCKEIFDNIYDLDYKLESKSASWKREFIKNINTFCTKVHYLDKNYSLNVSFTDVSPKHYITSDKAKEKTTEEFFADENLLVHYINGFLKENQDEVQKYINNERLEAEKD